MANTKINLFGKEMKNPLILASGIMGLTKSSINYVIKNGAGAATIKSISIEPRKGHNAPIVLTYNEGIINAVGYSNQGHKEALKEFEKLDDIEAPVIGSIIGKDADEFAFLAENFTNNLEFCAVEIPLSCPHTPGFGTLAGHSTPEATYEITKAVTKVSNKPVIIKISPNIPNICEVAKAAEEAGASAINAINTVGPGMVIDIDTCEPVLDFMVGGLSGPAIKPIAIRCVYDIYKAVKIPIIGTGGITTGKDAIEMMLAGASAVGLGSAIYYRGIDVFKKITDEMQCFMEKNNYQDVKEFIGKAHK